MVKNFLNFMFAKKTSPLGADGKLEVGKLYRNAEGDVIRIIRHLQSRGLYVHAGPEFQADNGERYYANGRIFESQTTHMDLVERVLH